jgi:hypothetical protein
MFGGGTKLLDSRNARIHTEQPFLRALGQVRKQVSHGFLAGGTKTRALHQAVSYARTQDDACERGNEIGLYSFGKTRILRKPTTIQQHYPLSTPGE